MNFQNLRQDLQKALDKSIEWARHEKSNARKSAYFSFQVGQLLRSLKDGADVLQVGFNESGQKESGEWLLDAIVAEKSNHFIGKINIAMECESSTVKYEFERDFAKLIHIKSEMKIYLHGLDHSTSEGADQLIRKRLAQAATYIEQYDHDDKVQWFFAFWPSPKKVRTAESLWDTFKDNKQYAHLRLIRLFEFDGQSKSFVER